MKTALVLSAGGMYGAYQAGAWSVLCGHSHPDIVVGCSIGGLNGWAIAAGCHADLLIEKWRNLTQLASLGWRLPTRITEGVLESAPIEALVRDLYQSFQPTIPYAVVLTDTLRLRPVIVQTPDIEWQHLAASVAILGFYRQYKVGGRIYSDGGLLNALPLWAAARLGAERIVSINCLPVMPSAIVRTFVGGVRKVAAFRAKVPARVRVENLTPSEPMGSAKDAVVWTRANADRWIELGRKDAERWVRQHSRSDLF